MNLTKEQIAGMSVEERAALKSALEAAESPAPSTPAVPAPQAPAPVQNQVPAPATPIPDPVPQPVPTPVVPAPQAPATPVVVTPVETPEQKAARLEAEVAALRSQNVGNYQPQPQPVIPVNAEAAHAKAVFRQNHYKPQ